MEEMEEKAKPLFVDENFDGTYGMELCNISDQKSVPHPFVVINNRQNSRCLTTNMLKCYFGSTIQSIQYRKNSREFHVFFTNLSCIESALEKLRKLPLNLSYHVGRVEDPTVPKTSFNEINVPDADESYNAKPSPDAPLKNTRTVDYDGRFVIISPIESQHPKFIRDPLVTKNEYTTKNSLIALYDKHQRYLNVKDEFVLDRYDAYGLKIKCKEDPCELNYRSGRVYATSLIAEFLNNNDHNSRIEKMLSKCIVCNLYTDVSCKRCGILFCDSGCFEKIADQHEIGCGSTLDYQLPQSKHIENLSLPKSGTLVKITAFERTDVVYVRSLEIEDDIAYCDILNSVIYQGESSPRLKNLPRCGEMVIYKFDKEIVRAMVLNTNDRNKIYIVCVDFGTVEVTKMENLYECNAQLTNLPVYPVPVLLRGVLHRYMRPQVREFMYDCIYKCSFYLSYVSDEFDLNKGMQRVWLKESVSHRTLNRELNNFHIDKDPLLPEISYVEDDLTHMTLAPGKNKDIVIMDNTLLKYGLIHGTILDFAYEITLMQKDIQLYGESEKKYQCFRPKRRELCIAKYDGEWCRGVCLELVGDGYPTIFFLDFGHIHPINVDSIRPYPSNFKYQVLTFEFKLIGDMFDEELSDEVSVRMQKRLPIGSIITFDEIIYDKGYFLRLDDLAS